MFLGWRVGLGEVILCGALILVLLVIPALIYFKTSRMQKKDE